jgi:hypothetical protein
MDKMDPDTIPDPANPDPKKIRNEKSGKFEIKRYSELVEMYEVKSAIIVSVDYFKLTRFDNN